MKKYFILYLLLIVSCGPSETEIQARIDNAVEQATSTTATSSTSTTVADSTTSTTTSSTSTTVADSTTSTTTTLDNSNDFISAYLSDYTLYDEEFGTSVEVTIS
ncbi:MAG: hypothetical protein L7S72_00560, partial [Flavobacteriales bacterium]|nr:hypothetical protein [Flavobacteriales bacterium]